MAKYNYNINDLIGYSTFQAYSEHLFDQWGFSDEYIQSDTIKQYYLDDALPYFREHLDKSVIDDNMSAIISAIGSSVGSAQDQNGQDHVLKSLWFEMWDRLTDELADEFGAGNFKIDISDTMGADDWEREFITIQVTNKVLQAHEDWSYYKQDGYTPLEFLEYKLDNLDIRKIEHDYNACSTCRYGLYNDDGWLDILKSYYGADLVYEYNKQRADIFKRSHNSKMPLEVKQKLMEGITL